MKARKPTLSAATDAMQRYAAGEKAAFKELYDFVVPHLYRYLRRRTRDHELTEDLLQQTLLQVHQARRRYIAGTEVLPWILTIAHRLFIDHVRRDDHVVVLTDDIESVAMPSQIARADEMLHAQQLASRFERVLRRLPQPQRAAFQLVKRDLLSLTEAAKELAITVDALTLRLFRANQALRRALATMIRAG